MFIINITYKVELEKVEQHIQAHIEFLDEQYKQGTFLASGRKVPRTGGIILAKVESKSKLEAIIDQDPFKRYDLADIEIIEFVASKAHEELGFLIEN
ncbi:MAG: YciI family protein [bacterium]|nr:YciI family protein [bacterium]